MDCGEADVPANVAQDPPGNDSCGSEDDVPLSKLLTRPHNEEKQSHENSHSLTFSSSTKSKKDRSASDDSSDDEPLIKLKTISAPAEKPFEEDNTLTRSNGTNNKKADLNTDDSSENEPLIKIAKVSSKAAKKPSSVPSKKSVDRKKKVNYAESSSGCSDDEPLAAMKRKLTKAPKEQKTTANSKKTKSKLKEKSLKESLADDSLDDEPLNELAKKVQSTRQRQASVSPSRNATPVMKSKRNAARKTVKYAESSSDSLDDEPLAVTKRKLTKASKEQKTSAVTKKTKSKLKDKSLKDSSSNDDDDDVPLVNLIAKKKNTKATDVSQVSASRKRQELSNESSEDEPLINLVKKSRTDKQTQPKTKASAPKKRDTSPKKPRKVLVSGSSSNRSDDEPLIKAAKHPQVTKILRIILERCDGEDTGATESLNKTSTDTPVTEKTLSEKSEGSEESSEEE